MDLNNNKNRKVEGRTLYTLGQSYHDMTNIDSDTRVQRKIVLIKNMVLIFVLLCCCFCLVHYISPSLTANGIWKSFSVLWVMPVKLQNAVFHGHQPYFRKYFQMLLAVNIGHV